MIFSIIMKIIFVKDQKYCINNLKTRQLNEFLHLIFY
jgi:hypothetical protein